MAAASGGSAIWRFNDGPRVTPRTATWNPALGFNTVNTFGFDAKFFNDWQATPATIVTVNLVVSYPAAYVADLPLQNLSAGLTELGRVVSGGTITFTLRLTTSVGNSSESPLISWNAAAVPNVNAQQAFNVGVVATSPEASTTLSPTVPNNHW